MIQHETPVESHNGILVKREDLSCPYPGPMFSKMRGVLAHIEKRKEPVIGVLDTFHSKGGWAVAYCCKALGRECQLFYPEYVADFGQPLRQQQQEARKHGAILTSLKAGRSAILFHQAKKLLPLSGYMIPNGLKLQESVDGTAEEVRSTAQMEWVNNVVVSISSATLASGVIKGLAALRQHQPRLILHMGYSRSQDTVRRFIEKMSGVTGYGYNLVDEGFAYRDKVDHPAPFPCNPYYDLKAWRWLERNRDQLKGDILFWNIGA